MAADGIWKLSMTTPMGTQTPTLTLVSSGSALTGTMEGAQGTVDIEDGAVDGDNVTWAITAAQMGMKIVFKGAINGDAISGSADIGTFGSATFEGTRG